jgi:hypothetical protein
MFLTETRPGLGATVDGGGINGGRDTKTWMVLELGHRDVGGVVARAALRRSRVVVSG